MAKIDLSKRSKAEKLCYDVFSALDPTGVNTKKYRDIFSNMSDTEFVKLMTNMIEDDTLNFVLDVVDFERDADLVKAKKAADILNIPLEEYAIMPFVNGNKDNPTITKEKVFVGYIIEKRLQQTTQKKNGISINIADRSPTTGQVVNHDKNGRSSDQENMALFATGAINAATEFNGFRADGMQRKNQAYSSITQKGYCTLEELDAGIEDRTILNTIDVLYTGMSIKTDLVNNDYMLIDTMKKIKQKTAATKESVEVDDDYRTVTESIRVVPKNTIPNDILKLHTKLNSYSYGVLKRGKITSDVTSQEWNKLYHLLTPEEVDKYKGGCCWDFVAYQYDKLTKLGYKVTNYFIITDTPPAYDTHTISVIETDKGLLYIESAFKEIMGVYYVTSLPELFEYIVSHMWNSNDNQLRFDKIKYDVRKFDSCILYGATCDEYMNYMTTKTQIVYQGESINPSGRTADRLYDPPYNPDQIKDKYGIAMYNKLMKDDAHKFRALSGIELIHKEPSINEFNRIWHNWNNMTDEMKAESDKESIRLFGVDNTTHYKQLLPEYGVTEGMLNDVVNGVNPYSNKLFFHVSKDSKLNGKTLKPRIPSWITESIKKHGKKKFDDMMKFNGLYEDYTIPRVCFSSSIEGSINAMIPGSSIITAAKDGALSGVYYVYIPEKPINEYKHIKNKDVVDNGYVYDANITREMWVLEPVKLELYGVIQVESVGNVKPVKNDNLTKKLDKPIYNYKNDIKWKWKIHPTVIDKYYSLNLYNQ